MTSDRVEGKAKEVVGGAERQVGDAMGDRDMEARGANREMEGKAQGLWGRIKNFLHI
jgi:uncharacterized protein YjbJ (UPF0337 family)